MKRALSLVMLAACGNGSGDGFPVEPGGPGGGINTPVDAALIDAVDPDALSTLAGRVCIATDPRTPTTACAATGAGGITVKLGTKTAMTAADGSFVIEKSSGSNLRWRASGATIATSVVPFGTSNIVPAIDMQDYLELQNASGVLVATASIFVRVVKNTTPQVGVNATATPDGVPLYANAAPFEWAPLATGTTGFGIIWIPNVSVSAETTVTATLDAGGEGKATILVEDQTVTYLTIQLP